jgi:predicted hotdog family 3-hydroxylacyl-ACP dehydratase
MATMIDRAWIARHIPHHGSMCLLDSVQRWDADRVVCRAVSHRAADNPLRAHGRLGAACGIEYAAQAMAVHGALLAPPDAPTARVGYLASVRGARLFVARLDDAGAALEVTATATMRDNNNVLYDFTIDAAGERLVEGRAAVVLDAAALKQITP